MSTAETIIQRSAERGVQFYRDGEMLRWHPPVAMTDEQRACLVRHKQDVLARIDAETDEILDLLSLPCGRLTRFERVEVAV